MLQPVLEFLESDVSPGKTEVKEGKFFELMFSVLSSIKNKLICTISLSDFNLTQRSGVCKVTVFATMLVYTFSH